MEKEVFNLLKNISEKGFIEDEVSDRINPEQRKLDFIKDRKFTILLQQGLIRNNGNNILIITEYGYDVAQHSSWIEYLKYNEKLQKKRIEKESLDYKISWFQSKTGWLPYLFSMIGIGISIWALVESKSNKPTNIPEQQEKKENKQLPSKNSPTKDTLNEKEKYIDSLNVSSR
ncbi:hypothetical protein ACFFVB_15840 [Formosa undariae]|uniref:Uncharacterized protein n=1 Tax=Formosa undariae TaxID=1325436 RepID=A0ABV5F548_9FLAO